MTDIEYLKIACEYARDNSTDPSTQNGAIIVCPSSGKILTYGANHFPVGVKETEERWQRPLKYSFVEHAEKASILVAARAGIRLEGATMYCLWYACAECSKAIIQAGIKRVIGKVRDVDDTNARWFDTICIGDQMMKEAGVETIFIDSTFNVQLRRNGQLITF